MHGEGSMDEFKRMLADTSPALLGLTMLVTILHTVFDVLAFKVCAAVTRACTCMHACMRDRAGPHVRSRRPSSTRSP